MYTLSKYKAVLSVVFAIAMGLMLVPQFALSTTDPFGIKQIENPAQGDGILLGKKDVREVITDVINIALGMLGIVAVGIVLWGGFKWMTAGGNDDQTGEARKIIFSGIIGLAIIMSAWAIARFVLVQLGTATQVNNGVIIQ